ncbi:hypothetical protein PA598K_05205 [Paenibacillus sp. 598K]|uniref:AraC family transcriptional regulator n=1 Tax=Paenibacillus sp. 598K TaxID=1117987 RepID=UPI000FF973D6|nr:AraC family transcriptional regulator [Paenibacillus sp. 598K]GBF76719.1 hypothetical protein PA598K_05205 [Paenibacillus sp. 598K]
MYVLPAGRLPAALYAIADVDSPLALPQQPLELSSGDCSSVLIVLGGRGRLEHSGVSTILETGMTAEFGPDARFQLTCTHDEELRLCHIYYQTLLVPGRAEPVVQGHPTRMRISTGAESLQALARELLALKLRRQLYEPLGGTRVLYELLHQLADCHRRADEAMQADAAQRVRAYLERHYASRVDKHRLAVVAGRSRKALPGLFRQAFGQSINEYTNRLRIRRAQELLLMPGRRLSEIAQEVGYKDEFYLSKKFKQATGLAPSVFTRQAKSFASLDHAYTLDLVSLGIAPKVAMADAWLARSYPQLLQQDGCRAIDWSWPRSARYDLLQQAAPDAILYAEQEGDDLDRLRRIAPVVQIPWQGVGWREHFRIVSELTGRLPQAEAWLARFDERAEEAREQLKRWPSAKATIGILNIRTGLRILYHSGYMGADLLYHTLGMLPPDAANHGQDDGEWREVSLPELTLLDPTYLIVAIEASASGRQLARRTMEDPLWSALSSVKQGRAYPVDMNKWYGYGPAAIEAQLGELMELLRLDADMDGSGHKKTSRPFPF